jgi:RNA polymerase sigma factor (sigma-70 family)
MMTTAMSLGLTDLVRDDAWARRLAARLLRGGDPEDLVQDAWVAVTCRPIPAEVPPRTWLAAVMRNLARLGRRSAARRQARERTIIQEGGAGPEELVERREVQRRLAALVLALPPPHRQAVLLRFYDDLSTDEVAARLGVPPGTARRQIAEGVSKLRARFADDDRRQHLGLLLMVAPRRARAGVLAAGSMAAMFVMGGGAPTTVMKANVAQALPAPRFTAPPTPATTAAPAKAQPAASLERYRVPLGGGPVLGPADAAVTVIEFVDYQCPFTARAEAALEAVLADHPSDVRFQVIHRPLLFHPDAAALARAALAADLQGHFWPVHRRLLARPRWSSADLDQLARSEGLDVERFRADRESQATAQRLSRDETIARGIGVDGAPIFFINGRPLVGAEAPARMPALIAEERASSERLLRAGVPDLYDAVLSTASPGPMQSRSSAETRGPAGKSRGYDVVFSEGGGCAPPLDAPALGFRLIDVSPGRKAMTDWSVSGGGTGQYHVMFAPTGTTIRPRQPRPEDFVTVRQSVLAGSLAGKTVILHATARAEPTGQWTGLWLRADGEGDRVLTSARAPVIGDWRATEVVLAIPPEAKTVSYGLLVAGQAEASMRDLALEVR